MISRGVLIGSLGPVIVVGSVMVGTLATGTEQRDSSNAEVGSCASDGGLPTGEDDTAGMAFIPGGTFKRRHHHAMVAIRFRCELALADRPRQHDRGQGKSPDFAYCLRRCTCVRALARTRIQLSVDGFANVRQPLPVSTRPL